jgi:hypothetical protein
VSSLDKTISNCYYEIEIDPQTQLPVNIKMLVLTGTRGGTESKNKKITGGKHVSFQFEYQLSEFGNVAEPKLPLEAQKVLARR